MKKNMPQNGVFSGGNIIRRFSARRYLGENITNSLYVQQKIPGYF